MKTTNNKITSCNTCIHRNGCPLSLSTDTAIKALCRKAVSELSHHFSLKANTTRGPLEIPEYPEDWEERLEAFLVEHTH